jgi:hypothetical protein
LYRKAEFAIWVAIIYGMLMTQKYAYCVNSEIGIPAEMIEAGATELAGYQPEGADGSGRSTPRRCQ